MTKIESNFCVLDPLIEHTKNTSTSKNVKPRLKMNIHPLHWIPHE